MNIKQVFKENPEGFSIDLSNMTLSDYKNGYIVAITDNMTDSSMIEGLFKNLLNASLYINVPEYKKVIGGWRDEQTKMFYLDLSVWVETREEAISLCKSFNQKAYYDCKEQEALSFEEVL